MADRTKKEICQIRSGDLILGYDSQPVQVLRNIKFTNKPRDYVALLEKRNRAETLILPGHPILYNDFEMRPEQLCDLGCAVLRPAIGGHVFTLCTENRTFVRAGLTYNVATWSEDGLANFLTHDLFGRSLVVISEQ